MKKVGVAILGLGIVGGGAYQILNGHREFYRTTQGLDITVESVLEPNEARIAQMMVPEAVVAKNIAEVVTNPDVNIVVECIGGVQVAREYVLTALNAGKTVVTSNKELIAKYSHELERTAKHQNAGLYFEASCLGGVPVIRTLLDGIQSNRIVSIVGIINGTTNYVLSKMSGEGMGYDEALQKAQKHGYAEADPFADVEGFDAAYKLSILASLAFHTKIPYTKVFREGITSVSSEDIGDAKKLGYAVKLLAVAKQTDAGIEVRVHPTLVKNSHPLASVEGGFNAVMLKGDSVGEVMLYGKGAGAYPTGSAIVSDVIYAATHDSRYSTFKNNAQADKDINFVSDFESAYYLRLSATDRAGALGRIAAVFGKHNISIAELMQKHSGEESDESATLVLVTHETHEAAVHRAINKITQNRIATVESILRVL